MYLAHFRKLSETGRSPKLFWITGHDKQYHDFQRGWALRGVQIRLNLEFKQRFDLSPDFEGEGTFPLAAKEAGGSYTRFPYKELLEDNWTTWSSATDESKKWRVSLLGNPARGIRISCKFENGRPDAIWSMTGCRESQTGVEFDFPFCFHFKMIDYEKTELEAFDRVRSILNAIGKSISLGSPCP